MHRFFDKLTLDPATGTPRAAGPVDPPTESMCRIWVWLSQNERGAAARGSADWSSNPVTPTWQCATTPFDASKPFKKGKAEGMAVALVKKGNQEEYFGWWEDVEIID
jgi:hypothetical protein